MAIFLNKITERKTIMSETFMNPLTEDGERPTIQSCDAVCETRPPINIPPEIVSRIFQNVYGNMAPATGLDRQSDCQDCSGWSIRKDCNGNFEAKYITEIDPETGRATYESVCGRTFKEAYKKMKAAIIAGGGCIRRNSDGTFEGRSVGGIAK